MKPYFIICLGRLNTFGALFALRHLLVDCMSMYFYQLRRLQLWKCQESAGVFQVSVYESSACLFVFGSPH